jgi:hypothetical protein
MFSIKPNSIQLARKKDSILGVFSNTLSELEQLKEEQDRYQISIALKIQALEEESDSVGQQSKETKRIISKISDFLR